MSQLIFDPHKNEDIEDALQLIYLGDKNAIFDFVDKIKRETTTFGMSTAPQIPSQPYSSYSRQIVGNDPYLSFTNEIVLLKNEKNKLNSDLTQIIKDKESLERKLYELQAECDNKNNKINDLRSNETKLNQRINELITEKQTVEKIAEESEKKLKDANDDLEKQKKFFAEEEQKIKNRHQNEILKLQNIISNLRKNLEKYEVPSGTTGEIKYFYEDGPRLNDTLSSAAPYVGAVLKDKKISYQFNVEKGKVQEAIQKRDIILEPFCDIIDAVDGGNSIQCGERGILVEKGGIYVVEKKAKISIILI